MRILIVGGTGTIGRAVAQELSSRHELIIAAYRQGEIQVDISDIESIKNMYQKINKLDAVISTSGKVHFAPLSEMNSELYWIGLNHKLLGQVNLVTIGLNYLSEAGSFTLTSGILNRDPIRLASSAAMVNAAIDGYVKTAAIELPRGLRINAVSPNVVSESMDKYAALFRGFIPVPAAQVALAYAKSVEGAQTGQVYYV